MAANMERRREDYLDVLGLKSGATIDDIKSAYKKQALQCHPDKNQDDPEATEKFQELSEAYTNLLEEEEKAQEYYEVDALLISLLKAFMRMRHPEEFCDEHCCPHSNPFHDHGPSTRGARMVFTDFGPMLVEDPLYEDYYDECPSQRHSRKGQTVYRKPSKVGQSYRSKGKNASDKYRFECEFGFHLQGSTRRNRSSSEKRGPPVREPSKKWQRKQSQRSYFREEDEYRTPSYRPVHVQKKRTERTEPVSEPRAINETSISSQKPKTKVAPPPAPEPPKKPSKKQLLAEQKRREREMAEIAEQLTQQQAKKQEREQRRLERERARQQELKHGGAGDPGLLKYQKDSKVELEKAMKEELLQSEKASRQKEQLLLDAAKEAESSKSKARRKREAKQRRMKGRIEKVEEPVCYQSKVAELANDFPGGDQSLWDEDLGVDCQVNILKTTTSFRHPDYNNNDDKPSYNKPLTSYNKPSYNKPSTTASYNTTGSYKKPVVAGRPGYHTGSPSRKSDIGFPRKGVPTDIGVASQGRRNRYEPQAQTRFDSRPQPRFNNSRSQSGGGYYSQGQSYRAPAPTSSRTFVSSTYRERSEPPPVVPTGPPAPPPAHNIWSDRQEFMHSACPRDSAEEEAMLQAALEMSRLEAEIARQEEAERLLMAKPRTSLQQGTRVDPSMLQQGTRVDPSTLPGSTFQSTPMGSQTGRGMVDEITLTGAPDEYQQKASNQQTGDGNEVNDNDSHTETDDDSYDTDDDDDDEDSDDLTSTASEATDGPKKVATLPVDVSLQPRVSQTTGGPAVDRLPTACKPQPSAAFARTKDLKMPPAAKEVAAPSSSGFSPTISRPQGARLPAASDPTATGGSSGLTTDMSSMSLDTAGDSSPHWSLFRSGSMSAQPGAGARPKVVERKPTTAGAGVRSKVTEKQPATDEECWNDELQEVPAYKPGSIRDDQSEMWNVDSDSDNDGGSGFSCPVGKDAVEPDGGVGGKSMSKASPVGTVKPTMQRLTPTPPVTCQEEQVPNQPTNQQQQPMEQQQQQQLQQQVLPSVETLRAFFNLASQAQAQAQAQLAALQMQQMFPVPGQMMGATAPATSGVATTAPSPQGAPPMQPIPAIPAFMPNLMFMPNQYMMGQPYINPSGGSSVGPSGGSTVPSGLGGGASPATAAPQSQHKTQ